MLVVADTSPLRYLVVIQAIELLPLLYERVVVPQAVLTELQHPRSPREVRAWLATPPAWVEVRQPQQRTRLARLGPGEQGCDRAIPNPNRSMKGFACKIIFLLKISSGCTAQDPMPMGLAQGHKQRSGDKPALPQLVDFSRYARPSEKPPYAYRRQAT